MYTQGKIGKRSEAQEKARTEREEAAAKAKREQEVYLKGAQGLEGFNPAKGRDAVSQYRMSQPPENLAQQVLYENVARHDARAGRQPMQFGPSAPDMSQVPAISDDEMQSADMFEAAVSAGESFPPEMLPAILERADALRRQLGPQEFMTRYPGLDAMLNEGQ